MRKWLSFLICVSLVAGLLVSCSNRIPEGLYRKDKDNAMEDGKRPEPKNTNFAYAKSEIDLEIVERNTDFAFNIFKELNKEDKEQSVFISPLSISTALAMTYQGAEGTTKEAMAKALKYSDIEPETLNKSYKNLVGYLMDLDKKVELNISNSIWVREGFPVHEDFLTTNRDIYNALVTNLDFSKADAAEEINQWISDATNKKIEEMIESPIESDVIMYLINAIYFKGEWTKKFDKKDSFSTQFQSGSGRSQDIIMMRRKGLIEYGQGQDFKAVRLPYGKGTTAMYCILPEEGTSLNDFISGLNTDKWVDIKDSISEEEDVILELPRFKLEYGIKELKNSLSTLGMEITFSEEANFSSISEERIYIHNVLHKAIIDVNEEGSEAAAATVVDMKATGIMDPITFVADRPFFFAIVDDETGSILFMGKAYDLE